MKLNAIPYSRASSGDKALADLQKALQKFGCASFGTAIDAERGTTIVTFKHRDRVVKLEASWKGYAQALLRGQSFPSYGDARRKAEAAALAQARISVASALRDWGKAQLSAIESGVLSFEAVFMPFMLLPSGERVIDVAAKQNLLPAPGEEKVVEIGGNA